MKKIEGIFFPDHANGYDKMIKEIISSFPELPQDFDKKLNDASPELIDNYDSKLADFILSNFDDKACRNRIEIMVKYQNETVVKNFETFKHFFSYLQASYEIQLKVNEEVKNNPIALSNCDNVIVGLYAYILRISDQIASILTSGYPDGVMRLWRSLYEYCVSLLFIIQNRSEVIAKRFIDFGFISYYRRIESYKVRHEELKFPPVEDIVNSETSQKLDSLKKLYGEDFLKNEWNWAITDPSIKRITFRDVEEQVGVSRFRPFYLWASTYTHSSFNALLDFYEQEKGHFNIDNVLDSGLDKKTIIDPVQLTCGILHEVNVRYLEEVSIAHEVSVNVLLFRKILDSLHDSFK